MTWKEIWETTKCNESHEFDIQVWHPVLLQNYTEIIYLNSTKQNISQFHNLRKNYFQFKKKKIFLFKLTQTIVIVQDYTKITTHKRNTF